MIDVGEKAPDFELNGVYQGEMDMYRLSDYVDEGPVVLAFYVFDFSPGCTTEMCRLRDMGWFNFTENLSVFGISTDGIFSHKEFAQQNNLDFPLLSDTAGKVSEDYGVLYDVMGFENVSKRSIFVVDEDQVVRYSWSSDNPATQPDLDSAKEAIESL